jgi:endoglucanase
MMKDSALLFKRLQKLTSIPSTSGFEQKIVNHLYSEIRPIADRCEIDYFGNIYAYLMGASNEFKIMIPAHSDSVGMIISYIEDNGFVRFDVLGAVPPNLVYGQRVIISTPQGGKIGVIATKPGHLSFNNALGTSVPPIDALLIDVGALSKREAESMGIEPGQQVTFERDLRWLGDESTGLVSGKSLDDKVGCLVLLETLKRLKAQQKRPSSTLIFLMAVKEEIGFRGARQAGQRIKPNICIGIDATISQSGSGSGIASMPETSFSEAATALRLGPCISVCDLSLQTGTGLMGHPKLIKFLKEEAKKHHVPFQIEGSMPGISSDASAFQDIGPGIPSITVKIPSRYTHGPIEVVSLKDVEATIDLLVYALPIIGPDFDLTFTDIDV